MPIKRPKIWSSNVCRVCFDYYWAERVATVFALLISLLLAGKKHREQKPVSAKDYIKRYKENVVN